MKRGGELDKPEIADEPAVEASEAVEADHPGRPRPEAALTLDARSRGARRDAPQALEVPFAREADEDAGLAGRQAVPNELGGGVTGEGRAVGRQPEVVVDGGRDS
jgi:hypothetical protein